MSSSLDLINHYLNRSAAQEPPKPAASPNSTTSSSNGRPKNPAPQQNPHHVQQNQRIASSAGNFVDFPPIESLPSVSWERLTTAQRMEVIKKALKGDDYPILRRELENLSWLAPCQVTREEFQDEKLGIGMLIFDIWDNNKLPSDIRMRAGRLFTRWRDGVFTEKPTERWGAGVRRPSPGIGDLGFIVGEIFLNRAAVVASNIHRASQAGIAGSSTAGGCHSILLSASEYDDADYGDHLWYSGTRSSDGNLSRHTMLLEQSFQNGNPVRVLRNDKCHWRHRPAAGIRYDGLYRIDDKKRTRDGGAGNYKYHLTRLPNQDRIQLTPFDLERRHLNYFNNNGI